MNAGERVAVPWDRGVIFKCPCGARDMYVASPPHTIKFDEHNALTIHASCGYSAKQHPPRPQNWCHFWLKGGEVEMCEDAKCPGGTGEIA